MEHLIIELLVMELFLIAHLVIELLDYKTNGLS